MTKIKVQTGIPYLNNGNPIVLENKGIIGVSEKERVVSI